MIKTHRQYNGHWVVYDKDTMVTADIYRIGEYNPLGSGEPRYRIDFRGKTVKSMIDNFNTAKSIATKYVRGEM